MSAASASRVVLRRRPQLPTARRWASTSEKASEVAEKAKGTAANIQSKASEGLSRVTSSAGPALSGASKAVGKSVGKIGGRTGRLIAMIECEYFKVSVISSEVGGFMLC